MIFIQIYINMKYILNIKIFLLVFLVFTSVFINFATLKIIEK